MSCGNPRHVDCGDCNGEIIVGQFDYIALPKVDEEGFPAVDLETGEILKVRIPLPRHVLMQGHSVPLLRP